MKYSIGKAAQAFLLGSAIAACGTLPPAGGSPSSIPASLKPRATDALASKLRDTHGCKTMDSVETVVLAPGSKERWTATGCGKTVSIEFTLLKDARGGTMLVYKGL